MKKMISEYIIETPHLGEIIVESINYTNGRCGLVASNDRGYNGCLTKNIEGEDIDKVLLVASGRAGRINNWLIDKTDMFEVLEYSFGDTKHEDYIVVTVKESYYEKQD